MEFKKDKSRYKDLGILKAIRTWQLAIVQQNKHIIQKHQ
jgi:hypothetical protein